MNTQRKMMKAVALVTALACADAMWALPEGRYPEAFGAADDRGTLLLDKPGRSAPSKRLGLAVEAVPQVALAGVDREALLKADEKAQREGRKILRLGIGRDVTLAASDGHWYDLQDGGRLWVAEIVSPGALGLRLHFAKARLPQGVEVAVYAPEGADRKARYLETGFDLPSPEPEVFGSKAGLDRSGGWTRTLLGERARIEVYFPKSAARRAGRVLPFVVDRLQHVYLDPVAQMAGVAKDLAGPCHNDVACFPEWSNVAKAVAVVNFVIGGDTFGCTGQLLNAENSDKTPYWLTANHCISTQAVAQTAEVFWRYQNPSCGGPTPALSSVQSSTGATLLQTGTSSDFTLLMIEGTIPSGLFWAGWTSSPVANGTESTAIHHPWGEYKRISFGAKASSPTCGGSNNVRINWTDGPTEPGSSGSGIFRDDTQQLYGQLECGPSSCDNETNDSYGAFSVTYPNISALLVGGSDDASENNDACSTPKVITSGTLADRIVKSTDVDWYQFNLGPYRKLTVNLSFTHANGDIDTALYAACGGSVVKSSAGTGDTEVMTYANVSSETIPVYVKVYLYSDTRNSYDMTAASAPIINIQFP